MLIRTLWGRYCHFPDRIAVCPVCCSAYVGFNVQDYCEDCRRKVEKFRTSAAHQVHKAVKRGDLPQPHTLDCVDCGRPAQLYEHRDYGKPLDVVPACTGCNKARGHARGFGELGDHQRAMRRSQRTSLVAMKHGSE